MSKRPTITDVARAAGVSVAVVSYTLNGRPGVSASTRERVLRVAEEYGWRPSAAARSLRSTPRTAGLVLPADGGNLRGEDRLLRFVTALQAAVHDGGVGVLLHVARDQDEAVRVCRDWWAERQVYAVVVPDVRRDDVRLERLAELGVPAVALDGPPDAATPAVWADETAAFTGLADYLTSLGHRRLARVTTGGALAAATAREAALAEGAAAAGGTVTTVPVTDRAGAAAATRRLLQAAERPTVIVYDDDTAATTALDVARRLGVDVPWEVSVVSAVDSVRCGLVTPSVTAMSRDAASYGTATGRLLLRLLTGGPATSEQVPTPTLHLRGSTAPAAR